ncbi:MAG: hypothetical protein ABFC71_01655 [Methanoregula sp.]
MICEPLTNDAGSRSARHGRLHRYRVLLVHVAEPPWSPNVPFTAGKQEFHEIPHEPGLYRIRPTGKESLMYISETQKMLHQRRRNLRGELKNKDLMPWSHPHKGAGALWVWQDAEQFVTMRTCRFLRTIKKVLHSLPTLYSTKNAKETVRYAQFPFFVVIKKDEDGDTAFCPELQGCYVQGETDEEVLDNIRDTLRLPLDDRIESKEKIPRAQLINVTTVDVPV